MSKIRTLPQEVFDFDASLRREERQLVFVYLGSPSYGFCNDPEYRLLLKEAKTRLAEKAHRLQVLLRTIGASISKSVTDGIALLGDLKEWNEIIVGNRWCNSAMLEHVWNDAETVGGTPQVVVLERSVVYTPHRLELPSKRYLVRLIGRFQLQQWLERGLPLGAEDA